MKDFALKWMGKILWTLAVMIGTFYFSSLKIAFEAPQRAEAWFDRNYDRRSIPVTEKREIQIIHIHESIGEIRTDLRDMRNALIGPKR